jgi:hypothetical protein
MADNTNHDPNGTYSEVFEDAVDARQTQTVHRIRANSTIMQLKKILGEFLCCELGGSGGEPMTIEG